MEILNSKKKPDPLFVTENAPTLVINLRVDMEEERKSYYNFHTLK